MRACREPCFKRVKPRGKPLIQAAELLIRRVKTARKGSEDFVFETVFTHLRWVAQVRTRNEGVIYTRNEGVISSEDGWNEMATLWSCCRATHNVTSVLGDEALGNLRETLD